MVTSEQNFFQHRQEALRGDEGFISLRKAKMYGVGAVALAVAGLVAGGVNNLRHTDIVEVEKTIEVQGPTGTITEEFTLDPMTCYGGWENDTIGAGALEKQDVEYNLGPVSVGLPFDKDLLWWQQTANLSTSHYFCPINAVVERTIDLDNRTIDLGLQEGAKFEIISFKNYDSEINLYDPETGLGAEGLNDFYSWIDKIPGQDPKTISQINTELMEVTDLVTYAYSIEECGPVALNNMASLLEKSMIMNEKGIAEDYLSEIGVEIPEENITAHVPHINSEDISNQYDGQLEQKIQEIEGADGYSVQQIRPEVVPDCKISEDLVVADRTTVEEGRG